MIDRVYHLLANDRVYVFDEHGKPVEEYHDKKFEDVIATLMAARATGTRFFIQHVTTPVSADLFKSKQLYNSVKGGIGGC